ncbi:MAG TPA: serine/threonine-protein kinase [Gaiellaceae bacterium]|nr:serine/threonine-protein kinase [Gaiellaceae bacterium]
MSNAALALEGAGLVLDRYRPLRPLGSGGNGSVWLARDERTGLDVALKIVPREGKAAARAEREAAAAAQLRHPSCLRAYAFKRDAGHVYIAYEFVPGRTFREAIRAGELPDAAAVEACAQICDALAHAHASGILHRDVKPSNVLLGDDGNAKLLDFGLARMAEAETLTAQGDVPGTLAYISPERLAGDDATPAADVWAIGVMLWEALSGRHPFWQTSMLDTARAIEAGAPPLATLRPDLPDRLLELVDRALAPSPGRRPTAAELAGALRGAAEPRRKERTGAVDLAANLDGPRLANAGLAAVLAAWTAVELPFFPHGFGLGLALAAGAAAFVRPRLGTVAALAVPVFPLGNVSSGLAVAYVAAAAALLAASWREPRAALLFACGPLLAPVYALGALPLLLLHVRSPARRALQAALGVAAAAVVAGVRGAPLPLSGEAAPLGIGVAGSADPLAVAGTLGRLLAAHPALTLEAAILAAVAVAAPYARGRWTAAGVGAALVAASLALSPPASAWPLVVAGWATAAALAWHCSVSARRG